MHRLAVISTSKTDWMHDIAEETNSLAFHLSLVHERKNIRPSPPATSTHKPVDIPGVYDTQETSKLTVLASSVEVDSDEGRTTARKYLISPFTLDYELHRTTEIGVAAKYLASHLRLLPCELSLCAVTKRLSFKTDASLSFSSLPGLQVHLLHPHLQGRSQRLLQPISRPSRGSSRTPRSLSEREPSELGLAVQGCHLALFVFFLRVFSIDFYSA